MPKHRLAIALVAVPVTAAALAAVQQPTVVLPIQSPPPTALGSYARSAEIQEMTARARREIKPGQPLTLQPIFHFAPYTSFLEYRRGSWSAAVHPDIELFFVVAGSGTLVMGGKLIDPKPGAGGNIGGSGIAGGQTIRVAAGDFFFVPQDTPHQFPAPDGELVLISMHIPRGEAEPAR